MKPEGHTSKRKRGAVTGTKLWVLAVGPDGLEQKSLGFVEPNDRRWIGPPPAADAAPVDVELDCLRGEPRFWIAFDGERVFAPDGDGAPIRISEAAPYRIGDVHLWVAPRPHRSRRPLIFVACALLIAGAAIQRPTTPTGGPRGPSDVPEHVLGGHERNTPDCSAKRSRRNAPAGWRRPATCTGRRRSPPPRAHRSAPPPCAAPNEHATSDSLFSDSSDRSIVH